MKYVKWADILITVLNIVVIVLFAITVYSDDFDNPNVLIETEKNRWIYDIDQDGLYPITGKLGDSIIEIHNNKVRFQSSPCKDKLCVQMGWLESVNDWAGCLPNGIMVIVEGEVNEAPDAISQ